MWEYSIIVSTKISFLFMSILIFLEDSFNITWTKWWTKHCYTETSYVLTEWNKESCVTDNSLSEFSNPSSHFTIHLHGSATPHGTPTLIPPLLSLIAPRSFHSVRFRGNICFLWWKFVHISYIKTLKMFWNS